MGLLLLLLLFLYEVQNREEATNWNEVWKIKGKKKVIRPILGTFVQNSDILHPNRGDI